MQPAKRLHNLCCFQYHELFSPWTFRHNTWWLNDSLRWYSGTWNRTLGGEGHFTLIYVLHSQLRFKSDWLTRRSRFIKVCTTLVVSRWKIIRLATEKKRQRAGEKVSSIIQEHEKLKFCKAFFYIKNAIV